MATCATTYPWASNAVLVRAYVGLGTSTAEDTILALWWDAGLSAADEYLGRDWLDDDDRDVAHPAEIKLGLLEWIRAFRATYLSGARPGLTSVRTGQLAESYAGGDKGAASAPAVALVAAAALWRPYRYNLLRGGGL